MTLSLAARIVALHDGFSAGALPHAFGGALALAYCTLEPRATQDIDVNVFVGTERLEDVLAALPDGVVATSAARRQLARDGQARLRWDETPVDVFLANHPFHEAAATRCRRVPFGDVDDLPVLSCEDLAVFKAFFARPKDAVDLAAMLEVGAIDAPRLLATVADLLGVDHPGVDFVARATGLRPE